MLRKASPLPRDTALTISRAPVGVSKWAVASADELAQGIGIVASGQDAPQEYRCLFGELLPDTEANLLYKLGHLERSQVTWDVPLDQSTNEPLREACNEQYSLSLV